MAKRNIPKRGLKAVPRLRQPKVDWRKALSKQTKAALIDALVGMIEADPGTERRLGERFKLGLSQDALVQQTRQAITDATTYDFHEMNSNFGYDYEAYETIQKNLDQLIKAGMLESAMELALELMKSGSEQVEMSDEGLMTDDIEDCLCVLIKALKSADLPVERVKAWSRKMLRADCVGFICDEELQSLLKKE